MHYGILLLDKDVKAGEGCHSDLHGTARHRHNHLLMESISMTTLRVRGEGAWVCPTCNNLNALEKYHKYVTNKLPIKHTVMHDYLLKRSDTHLPICFIFARSLLFDSVSCWFSLASCRILLAAPLSRTRMSSDPIFCRPFDAILAWPSI